MTAADQLRALLAQPTSTEPALGFSRDAHVYGPLREGLRQRLRERPVLAWMDLRRNPYATTLTPAVREAVRRAVEEGSIPLEELAEGVADPLAIPHLVAGPADVEDACELLGRTSPTLAALVIARLDRLTIPSGGLQLGGRTFGADEAASLIGVVARRVHENPNCAQWLCLFWALVRELLRSVFMRRGQDPASLLEGTIAAAAAQLVPNETTPGPRWTQATVGVLDPFADAGLAILMAAASSQGWAAAAGKVVLARLGELLEGGVSALPANPNDVLKRAAICAVADALIETGCQLPDLVEPLARPRQGFGLDATRWMFDDQRIAWLLLVGAWVAFRLQERGQEGAGDWLDEVLTIGGHRLSDSLRFGNGSSDSVTLLPLLLVQCLLALKPDDYRDRIEHVVARTRAPEALRAIQDALVGGAEDDLLRVVAARSDVLDAHLTRLGWGGRARRPDQ